MSSGHSWEPWDCKGKVTTEGTCAQPCGDVGTAGAAPCAPGRLGRAGVAPCPPAGWVGDSRSRAVGSTHVPVGHVPVGPLAVGQHLPHDDAVAPDVAGRGELAEGDGLRSRPADRDLPTLQGRERAGSEQAGLSIPSWGWDSCWISEKLGGIL